MRQPVFLVASPYGLLLRRADIAAWDTCQTADGQCWMAGVCSVASRVKLYRVTKTGCLLFHAESPRVSVSTTFQRHSNSPRSLVFFPASLACGG